jgi:hypothetical protein
MPVELEIIRAAEFIRFGGQGQFDLIASCAALASLAEACKMRGINRALLDGRNARAELSANELAALVNVFCDIGFCRDLRLAILHSAERYQRARLFAFISRMKGWNVRAFGDFEQAMYWLSGDQIRPRPKTTASTESKRRISINHSEDSENAVTIKPRQAQPRRHIATL